jgi:galactoside O-acetyltransferase
MRAFHLVLARLFRLFDGLEWRARETALRARFGRVGRDFVFDPVSSRFVTPELLHVGDECFINAGAHVSGDVRIGDRVMIGPDVKLLSGRHLFNLPGRQPRYLRASAENPEQLDTLRVEDDVWIGAGSIVVGGVTVGQGSVLGAGSVASRDVPPFVVAVGVPARPVRRIFDDATLREHLARVGVPAEAAEALIARRGGAGVTGLPLAVSAPPERVLYRGAWCSP